MRVRHSTATALIFAMATTCSAGTTKPCSPADVLNSVGDMLTTGSTKNLDAITLRLSDLEPHPDNVHAAAEFDAELVKTNHDEIMNARRRYRPVSIRAVKVGTIERHVHMEGSEYFVDRIRNSVIIVDPGGTNVSVASLVRGQGCWRLESFGLGVRDVGQPSSAEHTEDTLVPSNSNFRRFSDKDYCTGATIYLSPSPDSEIGTLIEGYTHYRDPKSAIVFEAVLLQSLATGHMRGVWMSREQLRTTYVDNADRALQKCRWSARDEEVSPLPDETPAPSPK